MGARLLEPTTIFILSNDILKNFWVGRMNIQVDGVGCFSDFKAYDDKDGEYTYELGKTNPGYLSPYLHLNCRNTPGGRTKYGTPTDNLPPYGLMTWLNELKYLIERKGEKMAKVKELLTYDWNNGFTTVNKSDVYYINHYSEDVKVLYKNLIIEWESKGYECLNTCKLLTKSEKYEKRKKNPEFLKNKARAEVLRRMAKTGKIPKKSIVDKYQLTQTEIDNCSAS